MPSYGLSAWSRLNQVERVDAYTRWSLFAILCTAPVAAFPSAVGSIRDHPGQGALAVALAVLSVAVGVWVLRAVIALYPAAGPVPWRHVVTVLALAAVCVAVAETLPRAIGIAVCTVSWASVAWSLTGLTDRRLSVALNVGLVAIPWALSGSIGLAVLTLAVALFVTFTMRASLWLLGVVKEVDRARAAQGELAVAEERLRFARDVHDVLGRHLSTIAVQAELSARLAERDGAAEAAEKMTEVRAQAHDALREARELARGYRSTTLERELQGAQSLLESAGIATAVDVGGLDPAWHEPAGWVVREAVTNVLRHSRAEQVEIRYADGVLEVRNDGALDPGVSNGSGLRGLRDRLAVLGARLTTEHTDGAFALRVALPDRPHAVPAQEALT
jgi:two-component system, NarL family, sensor histidine kinase DesK